MKNKGNVKRGRFYIKKDFQRDFVIKFLLLIVVESLLAIALFLYLSKGTITTGYYGSELVVEKTGRFFMPTILLINLGAIAATAVLGSVLLIILSHRIAGPLYRFEKTFEEVGKGDTTVRFNLRSGDQLSSVAEKINEFNTILESRVTGIQRETNGLTDSLNELSEQVLRDDPDMDIVKKLAEDAQCRVGNLKREVDYFKTKESRDGA
ncbi:MAG: methyl-accepting chemotaxis protein [Deltaproteobacteria bacterium]